MDIREKLRANPKAFILLALWAVSLIFVFGNEFTAYVNRDAAWLVLALLTCLAAFLVCNRFGDSKSKPEIGKPEDEKVDYSLKAQLDEALSSQMSLMAYGGKKEIPQELYDKLVCCDASKDRPNNVCETEGSISRFPGEEWPCRLVDRIWGVLIGEMVVYNLDDYSLFGAARLAAYFPGAILYNNIVIFYEGDGSRQFERKDPTYIYNQDVSYEDWYLADGNKIKEMFPDYARYLADGGGWLHSGIGGLYFLVSSDFKRVQNAFMPTGCYLTFTSFQALAEGHGITFAKTFADGFYARSLRDTFVEIVSAYRNGALSRTAEAAAETAFYDLEFSEKHYAQFYVGYPRCSFSRAREVAADVDEISRAYLENRKLSHFNILQNGIYLNSDWDVNQSLDGTMIFPLDIYEAWSRPFTQDELKQLFGYVTLVNCYSFKSENFALKMQKGFCER